MTPDDLPVPTPTEEVVSVVSTFLGMLGIDATNVMEVAVTPVAIRVTYHYPTTDHWSHDNWCQDFQGGCIRQVTAHVR